MIYELNDTKPAEPIFDGWEETMITSCLQKVMGSIYADDTEHPQSALAHLGCFSFYSGKPNAELFRAEKAGFVILVPRNEAWAELMEKQFPRAKKRTRYAIYKDTVFDRTLLKKYAEAIPEGYEIRPIDAELYDKCLNLSFAEDFVAQFENKERFLQLGRGMVVLKNGEIVSGASSYSRYHEGIEIEVDTKESERRKHLALSACAALILRCLEEGLYPSWDAANMNSVRLSEKLGYRYKGEYTAYETVL